MALTKTQMELANRMGCSIKCASKMKLSEVFKFYRKESGENDQYRYIGPREEGAEKAAWRYLLWRIQRSGERSIDANETFFLRIPRARLEDNYFTREEMSRLLTLLKAQGNSKQSMRDLALIELLYRTGLRVAEACQLNVGHVID